MSLILKFTRVERLQSTCFYGFFFLTKWVVFRLPDAENLRKLCFPIGLAVKSRDTRGKCSLRLASSIVHMTPVEGQPLPTPPPEGNCHELFSTSESEERTVLPRTHLLTTNYAAITGLALSPPLHNTIHRKTPVVLEAAQTNHTSLSPGYSIKLAATKKITIHARVSMKMQHPQFYLPVFRTYRTTGHRRSLSIAKHLELPFTFRGYDKLELHNSLAHEIQATVLPLCFALSLSHKWHTTSKNPPKRK